MKKLIGVIVILLTLLLTVIYRQLAGSRVKDKPGQAFVFEPGVTGPPEPGVTGRPGDDALVAGDIATAAGSPKGHRCTLRRLREELPLFQLLIQ